MPKKMTNNEFLERIEKIGDKDYVFLEEYKGINKKIRIFHKVCGNEYISAPHNFFMNKRCPICAKLNQFKSNEKFLNEISSFENGNFCTNDNYEYSRNVMTFYHKVCQREFKMRADAFLRNKSCPLCNKELGIIKHTKTLDEFNEELHQMHGNDYQVVGEYINTNIHVLMRHKCGHEWKIKPNYILAGVECPSCNISKGERKIKNYLIFKNLLENIDFFREYKFPDCRNKLPLKFDFYFPLFNVAVEYDGILHYIDGFKNTHRVQTLDYRKINDSIKTKYCFDKSIKLIRIPHWDFDNIEQILEKELSPYLGKEVKVD